MADGLLLEHERIRAEALSCVRCPLAATRTQVVFARGKPQAKLWISGEGPGADEDAKGEPFVGKAGKLLDKILDAAKIGQDEVFITNTVLCRPPGNQVPTNDEIAACAAHRNALLDLWQPPLVVLLGATAARTFLRGNRLADLRGHASSMTDGSATRPSTRRTCCATQARRRRPKDWQVIRDAFRGLPPDGGAPQPEQADAAVEAARSLMPYLDRSVMTPEGVGRLAQVFLERSAVVLDAKPANVTYFATKVLAELLPMRQAG